MTSTLLDSEFSRPATLADAELVYEVYCQTPDYFENVISIPAPTLIEVKGEMEAAKNDSRRHIELLLAPYEHSSSIVDPVTGRSVVGYLDYKLDYPDLGDGTVNLLLILESLQSQGWGRSCVLDLEARLKGQVKRLLASIYGQNPRAERFWKSLDYEFAIDAKPVLDWYAKKL